MTGTIWAELLSDLVAITAGLTREGIRFEVHKDEFSKLWRIELRGY